MVNTAPQARDIFPTRERQSRAWKQDCGVKTTRRRTAKTASKADGVQRNNVAPGVLSIGALLFKPPSPRARCPAVEPSLRGAFLSTATRRPLKTFGGGSKHGIGPVHKRLAALQRRLDEQRRPSGSASQIAQGL